MSKNLRVNWSVVVFLAVVLFAPAAYSEDVPFGLVLKPESEGEISAEVFAAAAKVAAGLSKTSENAGYVTPANHGCSSASGTLTCNQTTSGTITNHGCVTNDSSAYFNVYTFNASAGQTITLNARSSVIDPLIILFDGQAQEVGRDDDSGDGLDALLSATVTQTGQFSVAVYAIRVIRPETGAFTIALTCSGSSNTCTPNDTTLCLTDNRFRVQVRYTRVGGQTQDARGIELTSDTGYFYFEGQSNVELVLKVLSACPSRFWVFAGGLTNSQVTMTVTDTLRGTVKTYTNPQQTPFQPIQDTNAFATCP